MKSFLTRWRRPTQTPPAWTEPEELLVQLGSSRAPLVIDIRGPEEFSGPLGHIENAVNTPLPELQAKLPELAKESRPIVLVCKTDRRSAAGAQQMRRAGIADVSVLRGGMEQWRVLRLPVG